MQCASNGVAMLVVGRVISGLCVGIASTVVPVYQSEIAPKEIRERVVALQQWAITWSILIQHFIHYGPSRVGGGPDDPTNLPELLVAADGHDLFVTIYTSKSLARASRRRLRRPADCPPAPSYSRSYPWWPRCALYYTGRLVRRSLAARVVQRGPQGAARWDGGAYVDDSIPESLQGENEGRSVAYWEGDGVAVNEGADAVYGRGDLEGKSWQGEYKSGRNEEGYPGNEQGGGEKERNFHVCPCSEVGVRRGGLRVGAAAWMCVVLRRDGNGMFGEILDGWGVEWLHDRGSVAVVRGDLDLCDIWIHGASVVGRGEVWLGDVV
ncbi:hypothetical protein V493_00133 [Pseudogymnoascus sp. VKM F-4281 (FW-2241)]|nr:hypothetical protein V493_00133 [Pseudogymnoascus sp. VKM F-4281 (FW-2241)]